MTNRSDYSAPSFSYPSRDGQTTYSRSGASASAKPSGSRPARNFVMWLVKSVNPGFVVPPAENFDTEELDGTFQQLMSSNLGAYASVDFVVGTGSMTTREGFLVGVGRSYILLYQFTTRSFIMCDAFSIKFVTYPYLDESSLRRYVPRELVDGLPQSVIDEASAGGDPAYSR